MILRFIFFFFVVGLSSCSFFKTREEIASLSELPGSSTSSPSPSPSPSPSSSSLPSSSLPSPSSSSSASSSLTPDINPIPAPSTADSSAAGGVTSDAALSSLPTIAIEDHELVRQWIRYFQGRGRHHMERYLARSTRYGQLMRSILKQNGMPEDLLYIALIESGFSSRAVSHASAVGYWQFIKPTGRRYHLEVNPLIDERRDPVLSTQAAAQYFKDLYEMFGSWPLAMASYNAGENRILKLVQKHKTHNFWHLAGKKRALPRETRHYVPKFMAAKLIAENPAYYGFSDIEYEEPLDFELISLSSPIDIRLLAEHLSVEYDELKILNPKFKGPLVPLASAESVEFRVPKGLSEKALLALPSSTVDMSTIAYYRNDDVTTHRVKRGETLASIAKKYKTTVGLLQDLNDIKPKRRLRLGQRLDVPKKISEKILEKSSSNSVVLSPLKNKESLKEIEISSPPQPEYHIVQKGDTLTGIAEEYEITVGELVKLNKLKKKSFLSIGLRLKLPVVEALPDSVAEQESVKKIFLIVNPHKKKFMW
jgi:membrane-bound lytic murein transglycosylase D